jgi:hypothetical protein
MVRGPVKMGQVGRRGRSQPDRPPAPVYISTHTVGFRAWFLVVMIDLSF